MYVFDYAPFKGLCVYGCHCHSDRQILRECPARAINLTRLQLEGVAPTHKRCKLARETVGKGDSTLSNLVYLEVLRVLPIISTQVIATIRLLRVALAGQSLRVDSMGNQ